MVFQNLMALDLLLASQGGVCAAINQSCCFYVNNMGKVITDANSIQSLVSHLHPSISKD